MLRRLNSSYRWPLLVFLAVLADAVVTFVGITTVGPIIEGNALARLFFDTINWQDFGLERAAGLYFTGYVLVGAVVAALLYVGREHIRAAPLGRFYQPALMALFAISALVNVYILSIWVEHIPGVT